MVVHAFNPSTLEAETGRCLWIWSHTTLAVPSQPGPYIEPCLQKQTNKQKKQKTFWDSISWWWSWGRPWTSDPLVSASQVLELHMWFILIFILEVQTILIGSEARFLAASFLTAWRYMKDTPVSTQQKYYNKQTNLKPHSRLLQL